MSDSAKQFTKRQIDIPQNMMRDLKNENMDINDMRGTTARSENGETTEQTIINLMQESLELRQWIRSEKPEIKVTILGREYTLIIKS